MKKTLTINLAGYVFHIDEDAYNLLDNYIQNLRNYFRNESGAEEIINDMEQRVSELFTDKLKENGREVITIADVEAVIDIIGKPEQMNAEDTSSTCSQDYSSYEESRKKLFRNDDDKILGGVCSGLAIYLGWDVTLVRIAMIILGIFVHGAILAYIVAWIVIPLARTASQKLSMQGKRVNVENIGKTVTDGFEKVKSKMDSAETRTSLQKVGDGFVACAGFFIKFLLILFAICLAPVFFALLMVFFVLIFVSTGLIVATPAMISDLNFYIPMFDWANLGVSPFDTIGLAICGILIIGIPIVGLIHMFMRYLGSWQPMTTNTKVVFLVLWFIAVALGVFFSLKMPLWGPNMTGMIL